MPASGAGSDSPGVIPVLTTERGVAAAKVTTLPAAPVVPEPSAPAESESSAEPTDAAGAYFAEVPIGLHHSEPSSAA